MAFFALVLIAFTSVYLLPNSIFENNSVPEYEGDLDYFLNKNNLFNQYQRLIDGVFVSSPDEAISPVAAIIIDNYWQARPSSGISKANLVIEAPVEGVTTRYLAFFQGIDGVGEIGPVRSARPYHIDWLQEFNALFLHVGGSPEALQLIKQRGINDLNEYYNGRFYWRDEGRPRPYNVYLSSEKLLDSFSHIGMKNYEFESWKYKDDEPLSQPYQIEEFEIRFGGGNNVFWAYLPGSNLYLRKEHKERDGSEIYAKNIVLQHVQHQVLDELLRKSIETVGQGEASVLLDGGKIEAIWEKQSLTSRTKYYNDKGDEIRFNRGTTWVEIIPNYAKVVYSNKE